MNKKKKHKCIGNTHCETCIIGIVVTALVLLFGAFLFLVVGKTL